MDGILVTLVSMGIVGSIIFGYYGIVEDHFQFFTERATLLVDNTAVVVRGDELVITGTLHNEGPQPIETILLNDFSAGILNLRQIPAFDSEGNYDHGTYGATEITVDGFGAQTLSIGGAFPQISGTTDTTIQMNDNSQQLSLTTYGIPMHVPGVTTGDTDGVTNVFPAQKNVRFYIVLKSSHITPPDASAHYNLNNGDLYSIQFFYTVGGDQYITNVLQGKVRAGN